MLTPRELRDMRDIVTRLQKGPGTPEEWATLAAYTLIFQGDALIASITAGGYTTFKDTVAPIWDGHGFREADLRRIYARVCDASARLARATPPAAPAPPVG